jgi:hypothetical protein
MSLHHVFQDEQTQSDSAGLDETEDGARKQAIEQIQRKRHFRVEAVISGIAVAFLVLIWALSEYHNAGGWPTHGFSQSSGIHDVWNYWIVYPVGGIALILAGRAWMVFGHKPITEGEVNKELERQSRR